MQRRDHWGMLSSLFFKRRDWSVVFSRRFRRKSRLLQWLVFFSSVQRVTSTFCALMQLMHIYQLLPYVLGTSFSTHPKRLTWDKKRPPFYIFRHYATYRKLRKTNSEKKWKFFSQFLVFWELLLSPVVEKVVFESFWALDMAPTWAVPGLLNLVTCVHIWELLADAIRTDRSLISR